MLCIGEEMATIPLLLIPEMQGWWSLMGCNHTGCWESDTCWWLNGNSMTISFLSSKLRCFKKEILIGSTRKQVNLTQGCGRKTRDITIYTNRPIFAKPCVVTGYNTVVEHFCHWLLKRHTSSHYIHCLWLYGLWPWLNSHIVELSQNGMVGICCIQKCCTFLYLSAFISFRNIGSGVLTIHLRFSLKLRLWIAESGWLTEPP